MRIVLLVAALCLATGPTVALDAIAYKGTLGGSAIVLEMTDPAAGNAVGRYSYMRVGGDIPLRHLQAAGDVGFVEEAPCTEATCIIDADGTIADVPLGGTWSLTANADGKGYGGTWSPADTDKSLAVTLSEIGRRELPSDTEHSAMGLSDSALSLRYSDTEPFTPQTAPYDFAKMEVALTEGDVQTLDGNSFRFVSDPRSVFAFPRVVAFADGSSTDATNTALATRHAMINLAAFSCLDNAYAGFASSGYAVNMEGGSLGDYDGENIAVGYLSPTVMGWTEAGSTYCGGAHPNNHFDSHLLDARTGKDLPLARIFKDWVAVGKVGDYGATIDPAAALAEPERYYWSAGQPLIDYVIANRTVSDDAQYEQDCGINDLIASNLGLRFGPNDTVIFSLADLPHAIFACGDDLLTVKLADIPELLAPTAKDYFPSLNQ